MNIEYNSGVYSMDSRFFTIKGVDYEITGTHKITYVYGYYYQVEFKNIETKEQFTVRHHTLCEKILKSQENEKEPIKKQSAVKPSRIKKEAKQTALSFT